MPRLLSSSDHVALKHPSASRACPDHEAKRGRHQVAHAWIEDERLAGLLQAKQLQSSCKAAVDADTSSSSVDYAFVDLKVILKREG